MSHRFIYECFHGEINDKRVVVHINKFKTDNRLDNLRMITQSENLKKKEKKVYLQLELELLAQKRVIGLNMKVFIKQLRI